MVRTHDIDGTQGDGRGIIYNLVPKYFDTDDEVDLNDPSSYDFEELDKVIDNILATGSEVYFRFGASQNDDNKFPEEGTEEWTQFLHNRKMNLSSILLCDVTIKGTCVFGKGDSFIPKNFII